MVLLIGQINNHYNQNYDGSGDDDNDDDDNSSFLKSDKVVFHNFKLACLRSFMFITKLCF